VLDRKKVLKHHPDKKAGAVGDSNDDAFFKCIQKANDVLTHSEKHRQFDSVDPYYDLLEADVPTAQQVAKAKDPNSAFFKHFSPVFEREARFSRQLPVPLLGEYTDSKEKVEGFYHFWYNFDSWRSFEYLDKEVNEGSDKYVCRFFLNVCFFNHSYSRDDKRYTEKKNKAERARRKKEDTARLRNIVDVALAADPRIKRIKQEEKEAREAKRKNKSGTGGGLTKAQAEEEKRRAEEEAKVKEEAEKVCFVYSNYDAKVVTTFCFLPCRSLKQRRKRRRLRLPTLRKRHAVPREPTVATRKLRNDCWLRVRTKFDCVVPLRRVHLLVANTIAPVTLIHHSIF
jgi:DnaJ family protein C protein 2